MGAAGDNMKIFYRWKNFLISEIMALRKITVTHKAKAAPIALDKKAGSLTPTPWYSTANVGISPKIANR